jgi:hypothetical protein
MLIYTKTSSGKKKKSKSQKLLQANLEHQKFLASVGYTGKRKNVNRSYNMPNLKVEHGSNVGTLSNSIPSSGFRRSIDDYKWRRGAEESPGTIKEIERKKTRIAPAYNKGAVQYISDGTDPTTLGRKI